MVTAVDIVMQQWSSAFLLIILGFKFYLHPATHVNLLVLKGRHVCPSLGNENNLAAGADNAAVARDIMTRRGRRQLSIKCPISKAVDGYCNKWVSAYVLAEKLRCWG